MTTIEANAKLADLTTICTTFPETPENEIQRDNMTSTLLSMLKSDMEIVVVEGEEGGGKTTLLAQFAKLHRLHTFCIFVRDASHYAWDPLTIAENLNEQIRFALGHLPYQQQRRRDVRTLLQTSIRELQRKAKRENANYYFVADGLDEIPEEAHGEVQQIVDCLPIGVANFRILVSGSSEKLEKFRRGRATMKAWPLPPFSLDETSKYFSDIPESREYLQNIFKASGKGTPGKLATIRRRCQTNADGAKLVLENLSEHLQDLFEPEWKQAANAPKELQLALGALCFDSRQHNVETLARFCGIEKTTLGQFIEHCTFLQQASTKDHEITFVPYFKRFAAKKLEGWRKEVLGMAISQLMQNPESPDALAHLPLYLNEAGHYDQVLEYLSPTHIGKMIECSESWVPLHQKTDLGIATASHLSRDSELIRFGLQRAAMTSLESCERQRSEIQAYIALGDEKRAYALAESAIANEDRLHILAILGAAKRGHNLPVGPDLKLQIRQLYERIDKTGLGDRAVEIAGDLFSCDPELAIELIHTSQKKGASQESIDMALAGLSLKTLLEQNRESDPAETGAKMRAQMRTPEIQKFVDTVSMLWGGYSAAKALAQMQELEKPADRIYLMRIWTKTNRRRQDAGEVVDHALDTIVKTTEFAPNAKVYRELAMPLPYIPSLETAKRLVARFDGIKDNVEPAGPTEEYVWLELLLAAAEARYDKEAARHRFAEVYLYIAERKELATKTGCMARLVSTLQRADPNREYDDPKDALHRTATDDLEQCLRHLLIETADHYEAVEPALHALTGNAPERALGLANALNTEPRRDAARAKIIESLAARDPQNIDPTFVEKVLGQIRYSENQNRALLGLLKGLEQNKDKVEHLIGMVVGLSPRIQAMTSADDRCEAMLLEHAICAPHSSKTSPTFLEFVRKEIEEAWGQIDQGYKRVDMGFRIAAALAVPAAEAARKFIGQVEAVRKDMVLDSQDCTFTHIKCCRLALRAFSGLIKKALYSKEDLEALGDLINEIPGGSIKAVAWSDLAMRLHVEGAEPDFHRVVNEQVKKAIQEIPPHDKEARAAAIIGAGPALFCAHVGTGTELINSLAQDEKDVAYAHICDFLLTKELPHELYEENPKGGGTLTVTEIWDVCELIKKIETDHLIYGLIEQLIDHVEQRKNWNTYTGEQRSDMIGRINGLLAKLPNPQFIQHEGYRILAEGQLERLEKKGATVWDGLIARAKNLPNHSDQAFVLAILAGLVPDTPRMVTKKRTLFAEAQQKTAALSSLEDRIYRYMAIFDSALGFDRGLCKAALNAATQDSWNLDTKNVAAIRERLVDRAYRMDKDVAANLASRLDQDPARKAKQLEIRERVETLELRDALQKGEAQLSASSQQDPEKVARAAWMALRSLQSGRIGGINMMKARGYIQEISTWSLAHAYPVLALAIESLIRATKDSDEEGPVLKALFKATLTGAQLAHQIAAKMRNLANAHKLSSSGTDNGEGSLIKSGEREKALEKIRLWARCHAKEFIRICDPYFAPENLDIVQLIREEQPDIPITILTSRKHQENENVQEPWDETYLSYWRAYVSDADPGEVRIVVQWTKETKDMPIHDRWCLSAESGLRLGTSTNSIGMGKDSEVSDIAPTDFPGIASRVDKHLYGKVTTVSGEKVLSKSFDLG